MYKIVGGCVLVPIPKWGSLQRSTNPPAGSRGEQFLRVNRPLIMVRLGLMVVISVPIGLRQEP